MRGLALRKFVAICQRDDLDLQVALTWIIWRIGREFGGRNRRDLPRKAVRRVVIRLPRVWAGLCGRVCTFGVY